MEKIIEILRKYFEDKEEIKAAYLYGSVVAGKNVAESDVDISLLTDPYRNRIDSYRVRISYQTEISRLISKDVDMVFLQEAGELLSYQILKYGRIIFERDRESHRLFRALRLVQCLDFLTLEERMQKGMVDALRREAVD